MVGKVLRKIGRWLTVIWGIGITIILFVIGVETLWQYQGPAYADKNPYRMVVIKERFNSDDWFSVGSVIQGGARNRSSEVLLSSTYLFHAETITGEGLDEIIVVDHVKKDPLLVVRGDVSQGKTRGFIEFYHVYRAPLLWKHDSYNSTPFEKIVIHVPPNVVSQFPDYTSEKWRNEADDCADPCTELNFKFPV